MRAGRSGLLALVGAVCACQSHPPAPKAYRLVEHLAAARRLPAVAAPARLFSYDGPLPSGASSTCLVVAPVEARRFFVARARLREPRAPSAELALRALTQADVERVGPSPRVWEGPPPGTPLGECAATRPSSAGRSVCQRFDRLGRRFTAVAWTVPGCAATAEAFELLDAQLSDDRSDPSALSSALVRFAPEFTTTGVNWRRALVARPGGAYEFSLALPREPELWVALGHEQGVDRAPLRFVVKQDGKTVLDEVWPADQEGWGERRIALAIASDPSRLELQVFPVAGARGVPRGLWGNPRVLAKTDAPNVLLITVDALRADHLSAYGYGRPTSPALEHLARAGTRFTRAIAQSDTTWMSLMALLSGRYPAESGVVARGDRLDPELALLPDRLAALGYDTFAGTDLGTYPPQYLSSFDEAERAFNVEGKISPFPKLDEVLGRMRRRPTFAWVHLEHTHYPLVPRVPDRYGPAEGPRFRTAYTQEDHEANASVEQLTPAERTRLVDLYDSSVNDADDEIRVIMEHLVAADLETRTIVIVTADHGELLAEHHLSLDHAVPLAPVLRVPLIMTWPDHVPANKSVDTPVQLVDLVPTVMRLVSGDAPADLPGGDLMSIAAGEPQADRPVYAGGGAGAPVSQYWRGIHFLRVPAERRELRLGATSVHFDAEQAFDPVADPKEEHPLTLTAEELAQQRRMLDRAIESWRAAGVRGGRGRVSQASIEALRQAGYLQGRADGKH